MILSFVLIDSNDLAMGVMPFASLTKIYALLEASTIETVNISIANEQYILLVDEDGLAKQKPVNELASIVANRPIVGRAMAVLPSDFAKLPYDQENENGTMQ